MHYVSAFTNGELRLYRASANGAEEYGAVDEYGRIRITRELDHLEAARFALDVAAFVNDNGMPKPDEEEEPRALPPARERELPVGGPSEQVLALLRSDGPLSRTAIAVATGLAISQVANALNRLKANRLVEAAPNKGWRAVNTKRNLKRHSTNAARTHGQWVGTIRAGLANGPLTAAQACALFDGELIESERTTVAASLAYLVSTGEAVHGDERPHVWRATDGLKRPPQLGRSDGG